MGDTDERPATWVGHVSLQATDLDRSTEYWEKIGMRLIGRFDTVSVLELRGGTHLVLIGTDEPLPEGSAASFDVMVEDVHATHRRYQELGFEPSAIEEGNIHSSFTVVDPSGYTVTVNSSHVSDLPV